MGRFIAEPLGEQPIGSEGSSRPALRTFFVGVYFTGTPVNISELSGGLLVDSGCAKQQFQILLLPVQFCLSTINRKRMT